MMEEDKTARMFGWGCTVLSYATTLQICFSDDNAKNGVLLWLLINILEAVVTAAMKTMTHSLASDHSKKDLVSGKGRVIELVVVPKPGSVGATLFT